MATVTKSLYDRMIENRPLKFDADEVSYRAADEEERCGKCMHMYTRVIDNHNTCEIFRPKDDESVNPDFVCDFFSEDGEAFPLLDVD